MLSNTIKCKYHITQYTELNVKLTLYHSEKLYCRLTSRQWSSSRKISCLKQEAWYAKRVLITAIILTANMQTGMCTHAVLTFEIAVCFFLFFFSSFFWLLLLFSMAQSSEKRFFINPVKPPRDKRSKLHLPMQTTTACTTVS